MRTFTFDKKSLISLRASTGGYQMKFFTEDRKYFVKAQAIISGTVMEDWLVEVIASKTAKQLDILCVEQTACKIIYLGHEYKGVFSKNFELEGKSFKSFENLLNENYLSTNSDKFIKLTSSEKLDWCALQLSRLCGIEYARSLKYMLDLAVLDCLVGNIDRHTRNFGIFYNNVTSAYELPLIFDSGMGLFENDYYKDSYKSYDEAMRSCYIALYGEDPFDMVDILEKNYSISGIYDFSKLVPPQQMPNKFAEEYIKKIYEKVKNL